MGLSNEERYTKAYYTLLALRKEIVPFAGLVLAYNRRLVRAAVESCDQLLGLLIAKIDTNTAAWILGENEHGLRGLLRGYRLDVVPRSREALEGTRDKEDMCMSLFANHMGFSEEAKTLARWWEMWGCIPALLYAVNRYQDECFPPEFHREMHRLIAGLLVLKDELNVSEKAEQVLLWKYHLFAEDEERPWDERIKELRAMTQKEVAAKVDALIVAEEERQRKSRQDDHEYRVDPVIGAVPPLAEAVAKVCKATGCTSEEALYELSWHYDDADEAIKEMKAIGKLKKKAPRERGGAAK